VEETENPTSNELEMEILGQFINYLQQLILLKKIKIVNWYTGGLNHQIEHHIFPNISHIHYGNIAKSLKKLQQNATYRT
jgi:linoleoyl-CoA desaturase